MKRTIKQLFLLALLIIPTILSIPHPVAGSTSHILLKHQPILINKDSGFDKANGVTAGNGTAENPYLIEGWEITNTTGPDRGSIQVRGTDSFFIIRDVYIHPANLVRESSGILLQSVVNGLVENSSISNTAYGISLASAAKTLVTNNTISNSTNGIYLSSVSDCYITQNQVSEISQFGIWVTQTSGCKIAKNISSRTHNAGFMISNSNDNIFDQNDASYNLDNYGRGYGFRTVSSNNNTFTKNIVHNNPFGIIFELSTGNVAKQNNATDNDYGMGLEGQNHKNVFMKNKITGNRYGIYIFNSSQNLIYDNYLQNSWNAYDSNGLNSWNTTNQSGTNVVGGPYLGGNYYSDYSGSDKDGDGFGNTAYRILGEKNFDQLPLVRHSQAVPEFPISQSSVLIFAIAIVIGAIAAKKHAPIWNRFGRRY